MCCSKLIESVLCSADWPDCRKADPFSLVWRETEVMRQLGLPGTPHYLAINKTVKGWWWLPWPSSLSSLLLAVGRVDMWQTQSFGRVGLPQTHLLGLCVTGVGGWYRTTGTQPLRSTHPPAPAPPIPHTHTHTHPSSFCPVPAGRCED